MREGVPERRDRRGDGGADARDAAVRGAAHELPARSPARALRRAGHDRPHGGRARRGRAAEDGRLRVAIAFADLAGYARLTVERGDEEAVGAVERFVEAVEQTLPLDARVIKTLGDEVMVVGSDPAALTGWAVELQSRHRRRRAAAADRHPLRRGAVPRRRLLRARRQPGGARGRAGRRRRGARDARRSSTWPPGVDGLEFDRIGEVGLKGFSEPTELFIASAARASRVSAADGHRGRAGARGGPRRRACSRPDRPRRRDALRRARLGLPAGRRGRAARAAAT